MIYYRPGSAFKRPRHDRDRRGPASSRLSARLAVRVHPIGPRSLGGWFDDGRRHQPLRLVAKPARWDETVAVNTMAMEVETVDMHDLELGSGLTQDEIAIVFDFYAENDSVGMDVTNDLRDLLRGRLDVGPQRAVFDLQDYRELRLPSSGTPSSTMSASNARRRSCKRNGSDIGSRSAV